LKRDFTLTIDIKKIEERDRMILIYCNRPRALGEVLRYVDGMYFCALNIWCQGVTLFPEEWEKVKHLFDGIDVIKITEVETVKGV